MPNDRSCFLVYKNGLWVKIEIHKFKVLKMSELWVVGDTFFPNFGSKKVKNGILTLNSKNYLKRQFQNTP